ncbi:DUF4236 domain-containing protein [Nitrincola alkalilacustris]|uniref:DUF4236 domain-containing protein n=1 Tax=Nitrincola alkalilacustris TaxID=1571224 RepID=UPI00124D8C9E|nr:DUF4236 domain-containing protein [Nitrincola alkalilacustris]
MSFRFQRRIRIAPGLNLNLSKSGVGLSAGVKGATVSAGKRGLYGNLGLPGTGLSYRSKLNKHESRRQPTPATHLKNYLEAGNELAVRVFVESDGDVTIQGMHGEAFNDSELSVIRKYLGDTIRNALVSHCEVMNSSLEELKNIHKGTLPASNHPNYEPRPFENPKPSQSKPLSYGLLGFIWPPQKRRITELNQLIEKENIAALKRWNSEKKKHFELEEKRKKLETEDIFESQDALAAVLEYYLSDIEWPIETLIDFDFGDDSSTVAIDIDLPTEDQFPDIEYKVPGRQLKISRSRSNTTKRRGMYRDYAHGVALRIAGLIFNHLPPVNACVISAYTQSDEDDVYLYSVIVHRDEWEKLDFGSWNESEPVTLFDHFTFARNMTKTGIFKPVTPLNIDSLS